MRRMMKTALIAVAMAAGLGGLAAPAQARVAGFAAPNAADGQLNGVTCAGASDCWAVGDVGPHLSIGLIERWNGSRWQQVASPDPAGAMSAVLNGVSCATATSCWAVGYYETVKAKFFSYADHWTGKAWTEAALPNPSPTVTFAQAVSCPAASLCFADGATELSAHGYSYDAAVIDRWNGTTWSRVTDPAVPDATITNLGGIACASASNCWATGTWIYDLNPAQGPTRGGALGYHWNGRDWTGVQIENVKYPGGGFLSSMSCPTATMCMGGGIQEDPANYHEYPYVQKWNGSTWTSEPIGTATGTIEFIYGVSCATTQMCMSVGYVQSGVSLIEEWNGSSWAAVPSPNGPGDSSILYADTCTSTSNCWAVGGSRGSSTSGSLIERWNGTAWSIVPSWP
jgi:uncharacterized membrane protein